jgi:hypothetical protein
MYFTGPMRMSLLGPKAKKRGTLRWSADQRQTGRVPRGPRPPVVVARRGHRDAPFNVLPFRLK